MQQLFPSEVFARTADFDTGIRQLIPRYDEMLDTVTRCLPTTTDRILDLGCGTGELSLKLMKRCPSAQVVAVDYSPRMLQFAKQKIQACGYADRWTGIEADFGDWANDPTKVEIGTGFDACVSSLAIHHLIDEMKLKLFQRIRTSLNPNGWFWNAAPTLPESPQLKELYSAVRDEWLHQETTTAQIRDRIGTSSAQGHPSTSLSSPTSTEGRLGRKERTVAKLLSGVLRYTSLARHSDPIRRGLKPPNTGTRRLISLLEVENGASGE